MSKISRAEVFFRVSTLKNILYKISKEKKELFERLILEFLEKHEYSQDSFDVLDTIEEVVVSQVKNLALNAFFEDEKVSVKDLETLLSRAMLGLDIRYED